MRFESSTKPAVEVSFLFLIPSQLSRSHFNLLIKWTLEKTEKESNAARKCKFLFIYLIYFLRVKLVKSNTTSQFFYIF